MIDSSLFRVWLNLFIVKGSVYLFPLVALPILTKTLGVQGFGLLSVYLAIQQYGILIVEFGYNLTGTRDVSSSKNRAEADDIFSAIVFSRLFFSFLLSNEAR